MATVYEATGLAGSLAGAAFWILDSLVGACMFLLPFTAQCVDSVFIAKILPVNKIRVCTVRAHTSTAIHRHLHHRSDGIQSWQAERFQTFPNPLGWQEP